MLEARDRCRPPTQRGRSQRVTRDGTCFCVLNRVEFVVMPPPPISSSLPFSSAMFHPSIIVGLSQEYLRLCVIFYVHLPRGLDIRVKHCVLLNNKLDERYAGG